MKQITPPNRGYDAKVVIDEIEIGGQQNAALSQEVKIIDITNQIDGTWEDSIAGVKSWAVRCTGMSIKGESAFNKIKDAFNDGTKVDITLTDGNKTFKGKALISSFPIVANYNDTYVYNINFKGVGILNET